SDGGAALSNFKSRGAEPYLKPVKRQIFGLMPRVMGIRLLWQRDDLGAGPAILDGEQRERAGGPRAPIGGAARIKQQEAVTIFEVRYVAVAEDDDAGTRKIATGVAGVGGALAENVDDSDGTAADDNLSFNG